MAGNFFDGGPIKTQEVVDILLMVFGGGGELGLPDPEIDPMADIIDDWSEGERREVVDYAAAIHAVAGDNEGVDVPRKPDCLTRMMDAMDCQFA